MMQKVAPPLRDYLVGTTHRKDALEGVLWRKLRNQLAGRSGETEDEIAPLAEVSCEGRGIPLPAIRHRRQRIEENIDPATCMSLILQGAAGIVRWEPLNPNAEHRTCPSPGNRFTVDLELVCRTDDAEHWFKYFPREQVIAVTPGNGEPMNLQRDDLLFVLRGHVDRCAQPYGDLAPCLVTLEIGAMLAQLVLTLAGVGLGADSVRFVSDEGALDPLVYVRVRGPDLVDWLVSAPTVPVRVVTSAYRRPEEVGGRLLRDLRTFLLTEALRPELFPHGLAAADCGTLMRAATVRSSGLDLGGVAEGRPRAEQLALLFKAIRHLHAAFWGLTMVPFRLGVRVDTSPEPAGEAQSPEDAPEWLHIAYASDLVGTMGYTCPDGAVIVTVSADLRDYVARTGAAALSAMHLSAGIATQIVCIAAAHAGLACRPMRSFDHATADADLPMDHWSLIQLVVYDERAPNPAFAPSWLVGAAQ